MSDNVIDTCWNNYSDIGDHTFTDRIDIADLAISQGK